MADLPERFGHWNSVWRRFDRWAKKGVWRRVFEALQDPDLEWMILDSTVVRAHHACRRRPKNGTAAGARPIRPWGGAGAGSRTKIHIAVDALGNPVEFILTAGQEADVTQAEPLIAGHDAGAVIADKGYDSDRGGATDRGQGGEAVIPPKKNRKVPRDYDEHLYKERKKVERFIHLLKQYRRVATRYEKTARNFLGFVHVASIMILLR